MQSMRGSRSHVPAHYAFCDGSVEGFGSLTPVPTGYFLDSSGRLWSAGRGFSRPSDFRLTEDGELVEDVVLAEKTRSARPAATIHFRRRPRRRLRRRPRRRR